MTILNRCFGWNGLLLAVLALMISGCGSEALNNPYPDADARKNILYSSFEERPKHLDPARSYSAVEYEFIAQIYEPPLQYHFLKRPYTLIPATTTAVPVPEFFDAQGRKLSADAPAAAVARSVYEIQIKPGIMYQPHPALARNTQGEYLYHHLTSQDLAKIHTLADFPQTGTRELVAADYVYQLKRLAHPGLHSPILGIMSEYIVGLGDYAKTLQQAYDGAKSKTDAEPAYLDLEKYPLTGVEVVDRYTYRITVKGKYPQLLYWMAMPFFAPMPPEADRFYSQPGMQERNISLDWYPIGTGPYMLTENNPNLRMVLERNPSFHGEAYPSEGEAGDAERGLLQDAGKPMPFVEKVVFNLEKETIPYWTKFLQGYYDTSGISTDSFDQAVRIGSGGEVSLTEQMQEKGIGLATAVATSSMYLGINMLDPVIGGNSERARKLRQAVSIAVDYEEFISIFRNGRGISAQGPIPPGIFGYVDGEAGVNRAVYDWHNGAPQRKSIAYAKRLLAEAGYAGGTDSMTGKPLVLYFDATGSGPESKSMFEWFRKQFRKLDIQLDIRDTDYNRFQDKIRTGNAQLFIWGWNADYPDPENFLFLLYGPNGKVKHGGENTANYDNPEFDHLFEQMKNMDNSPQRQLIIDRMVEIVRRDAPWLWGFHPKSYSLYHGWYKNVKPNLMANNSLKYRRIDSEQRARLRRDWNHPIVWPLWLIGGLLILGTVPAVMVYRRKEHHPRHTVSGS
ncbi:MAG: ABC transporter substrate-binding protein [Gammaproteobacteria bacterium]|nr:ABC transporter substrate-binding protein [Gammaproteobacteria bacterium]